jgi:Ca2+-binding RTX toxin-like protein
VPQGAAERGSRSCKGKTATIVGTAGHDEIEGIRGRDIIQARGGADDVGGRGGKDLICGGKGDDELEGKKDRSTSGCSRSHISDGPAVA